MKIMITYYKLTGKYYTEHEEQLDKWIHAYRAWEVGHELIYNQHTKASPGLMSIWDGFSEVEITECTENPDIVGQTHLFIPQWLNLTIALNEELKNKQLGLHRSREAARKHSESEDAVPPVYVETAHGRREQYPGKRLAPKMPLPKPPPVPREEAESNKAKCTHCRGRGGDGGADFLSDPWTECSWCDGSGFAE